MSCDIGSLIMLLEEIVLLHCYLFGSMESEAMSAEQMLKGYLEVTVYATTDLCHALKPVGSPFS